MVFQKTLFWLGIVSLCPDILSPKDLKMKCNDDAMDEIRIGIFSVGEGRNCDQKYYSVADTLISPSTSVPPSVGRLCRQNRTT